MSNLKTVSLEGVQTLTIHFTKKKFRDFEDFEINVISQKINMVSYSCGVREPLEDFECLVIANFLKNEFKDFSISELEAAADKYSAGKLDFNDSHYQVFGKNFIGSVLKSYRTYRNKQLKSYHEEMKEHNKKEPTMEEKQEIEKEFIENVLFKPYRICKENKTTFEIEDVDVALSLFRKFNSKGVFSVSKRDSVHFRMLALEELKKPRKSLLNKKNIENINLLIQKLDLVQRGEGEDKQTEMIIKKKSVQMFFNDWIIKQLEVGNDIESMYEKVN